MSRSSITIISLLALLSLVAFSFLVLSPGEEQTVTTNNESDISATFPVIEGDVGSQSPDPVVVKGGIEPGKIIITGKDNSSNSIYGVFTTEDFTEISNDFYQLFREEDINSEWFDIFYDEPSGNISIFLYKEPLQEGRRRVTEVLLNNFDGDLSQLCALNIFIFTTEYVNEEYAGPDLGLNGCPSAYPL